MPKFGCQGDERGISEVVGAILVIGMVIAVGSALYGTYVQSSIHTTEANYMNDIRGSFIDLQSAIAIMDKIGQWKLVRIQMNPNFPILVPTSGQMGTVRVTPGQAYLLQSGAVQNMVTKNISGTLSGMENDNDSSYLELNQVIFNEKFHSGMAGWVGPTVGPAPDDRGAAGFDANASHTPDMTGAIYARAANIAANSLMAENAYWELDLGDSLKDYPNVTLQAWFGKSTDYVGINFTENMVWRMDVENGELPINRTLYAHQENTLISGTKYGSLTSNSADNTGTNLSVSTASTGRKLLENFVYPLAGVSTLPASLWNLYYRSGVLVSDVYVSGENIYQGGTSNFANAQAADGIYENIFENTSYSSIAFDAARSDNGGSTAVTSLTWSHTTGSGANRFMVVGVAMKTATASVSSITYGSQNLTRVRRDNRTNIAEELWYLVAPNSGTAIITVTLSSSMVAAGSVTYTGVDQSGPPFDNAGGNASSSSPSVSITVNTANSWLVGSIAANGAVTVSTDPQNNRWDNMGTSNMPSNNARSHGSDNGPVGTGSRSMSWTLSASTDWAASVVAIKPAPIDNYQENVQHNITQIPMGKNNYTLRVGYYTAGDSEPVSVYLYNFTTFDWNNIGILLGGSPSNENTFTYNIDDNHISNGNVYIRYVQPDQDSIQSSLMVDYTCVTFSSAVAHSDISILIRKSDNNVRRTIAEDVADSGNITLTENTYSGTYPFGGYTVENNSDYLEIDYYCHVTSAAPGTAYLKIDNNTLAIDDQTRVTNVLFVYPSSWETVLNYSENNLGGSVGTTKLTYWMQENTLHDNKSPNPIANQVHKIRSYMHVKVQAETYVADVHAWTDEITMWAGPPFLNSVSIGSKPIMNSQGVDDITVTLGFWSKDSPSMENLYIKNFSNNQWEPLENGIVQGADKVYWVNNIGGANASTQDENVSHYLDENSVVWLSILGENDISPFRLVFDYVNFQVNYENQYKSSSYEGYYGESGKLVFNIRNYSYPDQTYIYDDGAVIVAQGDSSAMISEPPIGSAFVNVRKGPSDDDIIVTVNHFVLKGSPASVSKGGYSAVTASVLQEKYTCRTQDNENVYITIPYSSDTATAWTNYLSEMADYFNSNSDFNSETEFRTRGFTAIANGLMLAITHIDSDNDRDIHYSETVMELRFDLA